MGRLIVDGRCSHAPCTVRPPEEATGQQFDHEATTLVHVATPYGWGITETLAGHTDRQEVMGSQDFALYREDDTCLVHAETRHVNEGRRRKGIPLSIDGQGCDDEQALASDATLEACDKVSDEVTG